MRRRSRRRPRILVRSGEAPIMAIDCGARKRWSGCVGVTGGFLPGRILARAYPMARRHSSRAEGELGTMGFLVEGQWRDDAKWTGSKDGAFRRQESTFRHWITADGSSGFPARPGGYHLYLALACPWCHRTLLFRALKRLKDVVSVSFVEGLMLEDGWRFAKPDPLTG